MTHATQRAYLIVNADDYGYFHCVSVGILRSASQGVVTATGVFANSIHFSEHVAWLGDCESLDIGVHLNLTDGEPLTSDMRKKLSRWSGRLPGKFSVAATILSGAITAADVKAEWRAQIERCLGSGMQLRFLNSHEHVHMLPPLFHTANDLAREYGIEHIRFPSARFPRRASLGSLFRSAVIKTLETVNRRHMHVPAAEFLGLESSGKLDLAYMRQLIPKLLPGRVYELMCHPGTFDEREISDPRLVRYHDWEGELDMLTNPALKRLLCENGVQLIGYRDLVVEDGGLVFRQ